MKHLLIILPCLFFPAIGCLGCSHEEPGQNPDKEIPAPPGIVVNHVPKSTEIDRSDNPLPPDGKIH